MGCGKPNNEGNPLFPKQSLEPGLTGKESEASDSSHISHVNNTPPFASFPFASLPNSHWENTHGMHQSYAQDPIILNNVPGLMRPDTAIYVHNQPSPFDLRGRVSEGTWPSGLSHPPSNMNFVPNPSIVPGDYHRNAHVGEGQIWVANRSQITGSSRYSGCNPSSTQSTWGTFFGNDCLASASDPGSFLTLGIGGQNLSGSSSFQSNPAGLPCSMHNNLGAISSHTIRSFHLPEACEQYDSFESSGRNLGIASEPHGTYQETGPYNHFEGDPASAFVSFSNANCSNFHPGLGQDSNLASEYAELMDTTFETTQGHLPNCHARNVMDATSEYAELMETTSETTQGHLPNCHARNVMDATPEYAELMGTTFETTQGQPPNYRARNVMDATSAFGFNSTNVAGVPVTQEYPGHLYTTTGVGSGTPLRSTASAGKILPQTAEATGTVPRPVARRPGEQPDYVRQSIKQPMNPLVIGTQPRSRGGVNQCQPLQVTENLHGSAAGAVDFADSELIAWPSCESVSAKAKKPSKKFKAISQPSHKREAVDLLPAPSWSQRRKLLHASTLAASRSQKLGTAAIVQPPDLSEIHHIKWKGPEEERKPLGYKCSICKRDLSFTPEGPVFQPSMPPTVAVLPCGHTFHDHCLQQITPEDQAKDPPCIPCALGEKANEEDQS